MRAMRDAAIMLILLLLGCGRQEHQTHWAFLAGREVPPVNHRPHHWAQKLEEPRIANLYQVSPTLYRGAEPTRDGMRRLAQLGVRSVVNVRTMHDTSGRLSELPLDYHSVKMKAWAPQQEHVVEFLRITTEPQGAPYFAHCYTGGDRIGLLVAAYRIAVQGWTKQDAIDEMRLGGFNYHAMFDKWYIPFLEQMDVAEIRRLANLPDPPTPIIQPDHLAQHGK